MEHLSPFAIAAILISIAALFSYINHKCLGLPTTIALMVLALLTSLGLVIAGQFWPSVHTTAQSLLASIDFNEFLLHGILGFLLFAGSLHIELSALRTHGPVIFALATLGTLISTAIVGAGTWLLVIIFNLPIDPIVCFLFGALISPTDPIAVLSILKSLGAPAELETQIAGESLFNDGVGVVIFLALLSFAVGSDPNGAGEAMQHAVAPGAWDIIGILVQEVVGGVILGVVLGGICFLMLHSIDNYQVEILISLALVTGGYALADALHFSGPITMVVAGLLIGNHGRTLAMSDKTREHLDTFWELIDEILNAVLFVLLGLEVLVLEVQQSHLAVALIAIPMVLAARFVAIAIPVVPLSPFLTTVPHTIKLLTWGGLRGGISVALALSLRDSLGEPGGVEAAQIILVMTYAVVIFSMIVQGLTVGPLIRRWLPAPTACDELPHSPEEDC